MGMADNLKNIVNRQKELLTELEAEHSIIESSDLTKENNVLKADLEKTKADFFEAKENLKKISDENAGLKNALYEQIYNEKLAILNLSQKKLDVYFKSNFEWEQNRLLALENSIKERINKMTNLLKRNNVDIKDDIYKKLDELSVLLNEKVTKATMESNKHTGAFSENEKQEFDDLKNEQITDRMIKESSKKNNFESFIGLNLINKLGIFLIIIGVIAASQYTYFKLPDILKGIMMFGLGGIMLVVGEILNRKKANIFSLGITSGGIAVLYVSLATSYFGLKILEMYPAIGLCVLITASAFLLSTRYNAQVILAFSLVGGYLPMFSIGGSKAIIYGAMIYFVVLNLLALIISFNKKWTVSSFIGLSLNIAGTMYICINQFTKSATSLDKITTILYVLFAFLIYSLIPIFGTYSQKLKFKKGDVILLGINTFCSSLIMYFVFDNFGLKDYYGLLAIAFAVIYLLLGKFIETKFTNEKNATSLFYLTGLSFVVLIIPFQFGKGWLTLGWLAEGVALTTYGILKNEKGFKKAGFIINALCLAAFLIVDVFGGYNYLFAYKYLAITLGSLIILSSYIYKKTLSSTFEKVYKYLTIINLWIYSLYISDLISSLYSKLYVPPYSSTYLIASLAIALTFLIAYSTPRIKALSDTGTKIISIVLYFIGILWLFRLNFSSPFGYYTTQKMPLSITIIGTLILVIISLLSVLALRDLVKLIVMEKKLGVEWFPLIVSAYFVLILTQNLITQYHLEFSNAAISIIYVITALLWIIYGFAKRYAFLRRFGLGLSVLAVAKLFIIDLSTLTKGYQIVSYFALGITLLAISFVYQYFNKKLELKAEVLTNVKENN